MGRTVKKTFLERIKVQAKEAEVQNLTKVAKHLDDLSKELVTRDDDASYLYLEADLKSDLEKSIWKGAIRAADYYGCNLNAPQMQEVVEKIASEILSEVRSQSGAVIGAYEERVAGEMPEVVTLDVEE